MYGQADNVATPGYKKEMSVAIYSQLYDITTCLDTAFLRLFTRNRIAGKKWVMVLASFLMPSLASLRTFKWHT